MTTVDVRITNGSGDQQWSLHNGLFGPASAVGSEVFMALLDGRAEPIGSFNCAQFTAKITGRNLAQIMITKDLSGWLYAGSTDPQLILNSLLPDDTYEVDLIEC
jgi:hypothetical protein